MTASDDQRTRGARRSGFGSGVPGAPGVPRRPVRTQAPIGRNAAVAAADALGRLRRPNDGGRDRWIASIAAAADEMARAARDALGESAAGDHLVPTRAELVRAVDAAREDAALGRFDRYAAQHHWTEPSCSLLGRCGVAMERGASALIVSTARFEPLLRPAVDVFADVFGVDSVALAVDDRMDAVRRIACETGVELELSLPDEFMRGEQSFLDARRTECAADGASRPDPRAEGLGQGASDWFGAGIVDAPTARIRARAPEPVVVACRPERGGHPESAATAIAEAAFGEAVLGGYSMRAASIARIDATMFSDVTAALLQVLEEREVAPLHPEWITAKGADGSPPLSSALDETVLAGRRIGLDEGATLVFERARRGERSVVFTNVDPAMRIGGALHVPATLALQRV